MGTYICNVDYVGRQRAVICDSVTEVPLPMPLFEDDLEAEDFLFYAESAGFEVRRMSPDSLTRLRAEWLKSKEQDHGSTAA